MSNPSWFTFAVSDKVIPTSGNNDMFLSGLPTHKEPDQFQQARSIHKCSPHSFKTSECKPDKQRRSYLVTGDTGTGWSSAGAERKDGFRFWPWWHVRTCIIKTKNASSCWYPSLCLSSQSKFSLTIKFMCSLTVIRAYQFLLVQTRIMANSQLYNS